MSSEKVKVFIVDDSTLFRSQIRAALESVNDVEVVGFAPNGQLAIDALKHKQADVVTLDLEMPVLNGIETLIELKKMNFAGRVLVFSSHSKRGADLTLKALEAGASDFLLKPQLQDTPDLTPMEAIKKVLEPKIAQFRFVKPQVVEVRPQPKKIYPILNLNSFNPQMVVIASSTGGPTALEKLFSLITGPLSCPILIVQHMPPVFTQALAERLQRISGLDVKEATNLMPIKKGSVYIAPGDFHMSVAMINGAPTLITDQRPMRNSVRPAADFLFESATAVYKNATLGLVLTGMGADGKDGALAIKNDGGGIFIQDQKSCVVFGMPGAVHADGAYDYMSDIDGLAKKLSDLSICGIKKEIIK